MVGAPGIVYRITGAAVIKYSVSENVRTSEVIRAPGFIVYGKVWIIIVTKTL